MSAWEDACRRHVRQAEGWDLSSRTNRLELRRWKRRLWWVRYGKFAAGFIGAFVGTIGTHLVLAAFGWTLWTK